MTAEMLNQVLVSWPTYTIQLRTWPLKPEMSGVYYTKADGVEIDHEHETITITPIT